jgi:hypothetical protein
VTTTTSAEVTTTVASDDDDDDDQGWILWAAIGVGALVLVTGIAWLLSSRAQRRSVAAGWQRRRQALLGDAHRSHEDAVDPVARWASLSPETRMQRWSNEMTQVELLHRHPSQLVADAPQGAAVAPMRQVAGAVNDLRITLGAADPRTSDWPPPDASAACQRLEQALYYAEQPPRR